MASKSRPNNPVPRRHSLGSVARVMGWAPLDFVGFEGGWFPTPRLPVLLVHGQRNVVEACKGLNHHLFSHPLSPRFGWLPAIAFATHERLSIEASIREAQRGELPGDRAGNVHWVAQQAATLGESLSQTGKPFYVFFRFFPNIHGPLPLERFVVLPDEEIGTAIEAEAQRWAAKNEKLITEQLRKLKAQSARRTGGSPRRAVGVGISLADLIEESDKVFSEELPPKDQQDKEPDKPTTVPPAASKGVVPRNDWFLGQYEASKTDTFHKPAKIHAKWESMTATERAEICPDSPNKVTRFAVVQGIKRARMLRNGKPAKSKAKQKLVRQKT